jgi:predicted dithiol-disulfide oxidoreductase (DUF899 family)
VTETSGGVLGESSEYTAARAALRAAELELVAQQERVAEQRRALPLGPLVEDYELLDATAPGTPATLSSLFTKEDRPLVVYHLMFGKQQREPCPMCTMWVDGLQGVATHVRQNVDLAVVAAAPVPELRAHAERRGWTRLRVLSAGDSRFKLDLGSEDADGNQLPRFSVFTMEADGAVRHRYSASPELSTAQTERGIDALCTTWSMLDLTPRGRGDWYASLDYGA